MKWYLKLLNFCFLLFLTGCGYHFEDPDQLGAHFQTISVPYIEGDLDGMLTDALIKAVALSNQFAYAKGGELILEGEITSDQTSHIGWQYDRSPTTSERQNRLVPNEGRREIALSFSLISARTGKTLYGPIVVKASSDFDFVDSDSLLDTSFVTPTGGRQSTLFFSLGQLDSVEGAKAAVLTPLYQKLAYKIVEGIENIPFNIELEQK